MPRRSHRDGRQAFRPPSPRQERRLPRTRTPSLAGYPLRAWRVCDHNASRLFEDPPPYADFAVTRRLRTPLSPPGHPVRLDLPSAAKGIVRARRFPSTSATKQLASTTTDRPIPGGPAAPTHPARAGLGVSSRMGLGPHPRHRPTTPRDALTSPLRVRSPSELALARGIHESAPPETRRGFSNQGSLGFRLPTSLRRAGPLLAGSRMRELVPVFDPLEHLLSRNRGAAGRNPTTTLDSASPDPRSRERARNPRSPRTSRSRAPPFHLPTAGAAGERPFSILSTRSVARFDPACAGHARRWARRSLPARLASRTACAARAPGVEGRFSRPPAKEAEIGCTRGAFHRRTTSAVYPGQESRVSSSGVEFSTVCHQPVGNPRRSFRVPSPRVP